MRNFQSIVFIWTQTHGKISKSAFVYLKTEKTFNKSITKFYNGNDVKVIAAELRLTKMRPTSVYEKHNLL